MQFHPHEGIGPTFAYPFSVALARVPTGWNFRLRTSCSCPAVPIPQEK
jgi:hypothetical protein